MKLYSHPLSGNAHKARLLLSMLGLPYEEITVDVISGEHKKPEFLAINPFGSIPVLVDGEVCIRDSQAILVYLARKYGGDEWLPSEPTAMAKVVSWLAVAANECHHGPHTARLHFLLGLDVDLSKAQAIAHGMLAVLDQQLATSSFLEGERPTIADLAVFPYVGLAPEGKIALSGYPNVNTWIGRIKALPGYVGMPGL